MKPVLELKPRHFFVAAVVSAALHLLSAAAFWRIETSGAIGVGAGGLSVALMQAGGAVGAVAAVSPEFVQEAPAPLQASAVLPEQTGEAAPSEAAPASPAPVSPVPTATQAVPPEPASLEALGPEPVPAQTPELTNLAAAVVQDQPSEAEKAAAIQPSPPQAPANVVKPVRRPVKAEVSITARGLEAVAVPQPLQKREAEGVAPQSAAAQSATSQSAATGDAASTGVADGGAETATGGSDPGAKRDFMARIAALLQRQRRYPRRARSRRQEGVGELLFVMAADGRVVQAELAGSSGHRLLDQEILAMLERAKPLPPFPSEIGVARLTLRVPVAFQLR